MYHRGSRAVLWWMDSYWLQPLDCSRESPAGTHEPWSEPFQIHKAVQKQSTCFLIVQMTMALGLHNEVLLAALQHFFLPALSQLLAISTSFPAEILRGLNQLSVVYQSVSVIPYNWEKLSTVFSFFSSLHISPISNSPWNTSCSVFDASSFLLFSRKKIQAQFLQLQWN